MSTRGPPATHPPKQPPNKSALTPATTRRQTASTGSLFTGRSKQDMLSNPAYSSPVQDTASARKYLVEYALLPLEQDPDHSSLSGALLHLSFVTGVTAPAADAIRLIAILIDSMAPPETTLTTPEAQTALMEQVHLLAEHVKELKKAKDDSDSLEAVVTRTFDVAKEDLQAATQHLNEAAESLVSAALEAGSQPAHPPPPALGDSYADILKKSSHAVAVARCDSQARTIHLTPPQVPEDADNSLNSLGEDVLVIKANLALEHAQKDTDLVPTGAKFLSVRKTAHGSLLYEVDSADTVAWLWSDEGQRAFASNFGTEVSLATKPFSTIVEYVPALFAINDTHTIRELEQVNDLPVGAVRLIRWIKPIERRTPNQRTAHAIVDFFRPEDANMAIKNGLLMKGKRCSIRKLLPEPTRCMKCQSFDGHYAKSCTSTRDTCGTCTGDHRTRDCTVTSQEHRRCANCRASGHAAWSRECPHFVDLLNCHHSHSQDVDYRYFPVCNNPATWVRESEAEREWQDPPRDGNNRSYPRPHPMFAREGEKTADRRHCPNCPPQAPNRRQAPVDPTQQTRLTDKWERTPQIAPKTPQAAQAEGPPSTDSPSLTPPS